MTKRWSGRIEEQTALLRKSEKQKNEEERQTHRRRPRKCKCKRSARLGCRLCQDCYENTRVDKDNEDVLCQGCPQFARHHDEIRWTSCHLDLAIWLRANFELSVQHGSPNTSSRWIQVKGWKGSSNVREPRILEGAPPSNSTVILKCLCIDQSRALFEGLGIPVDDNVTPRSLLKSINKWILTTHSSKWADMAGRPIKSPEFCPGFCSTQRCPNAAFIYVLCSGCIRRRFRVEIRPSTLNSDEIKAGLGLFACKRFKPGEYICDYSWNMKPGNTSSAILILITLTV